jgi:hypothetical protein
MGEGLVLAALLTVSQQHSFTSDAQYNEAIKMASLAAFQQSGMKRIADKEVKSYERWAKDQVSREIEMGLGYGFWLYKTMQDRRISVSWSF